MTKGNAKQQAPSGRSDYRPGPARVGEPTPQTHPEQFSTDDLMAEVKYLQGLNRRHGSNTLRTMAYLDLLRIVSERLDG